MADTLTVGFPINSEFSDTPPPSGRPLAINTLARVFRQGLQDAELRILCEYGATPPSYLQPAAQGVPVTIGSATNAADLRACDAVIPIAGGRWLQAEFGHQLDKIPVLSRWTGIWPENIATFSRGALTARPYDCTVFLSSTSLQTAQYVRSVFEEHLTAIAGTPVALASELTYIRNPVDTELFGPRDDSAIQRRKYGLSTDAIFVLFMSRITPVTKGDIVPFLRAIASMDFTRYDAPVEFAFAGGYDANYGQLLKDAIAECGLSERVHLLGSVEPSVRHELMAAADIGLIISDFLAEGLGNIGLEFMASGVPVVCTGWDGFRDTVVDGETGLLVPTRWSRWEQDIQTISLFGGNSFTPGRTVGSQTVAADLNAFCHHLDALLSDRSMRTKMGHAARTRAVTHYAPEAVTADWRALAARLAERAQHEPTTHSIMPLNQSSAELLSSGIGHTLSDDDHIEFVVFEDEDLFFVCEESCGVSHDTLIEVLEQVQQLTQDVDTVAIKDTVASMTAAGLLGAAQVRIALMRLLQSGFLYLHRR